MKTGKRRIVSCFMAIILGITTFLSGISMNAVKVNAAADDTMVVVTPWAAGVINNNETYSDKGYEYATLINGGSAVYGGNNIPSPVMADVDLSRYSEFRFAMKSDGSNYYELKKTSLDWNNGITSGNSSDWMEIVFKDEGNKCFQGFVNGSWVPCQLPLDSNLSDLQMRYATQGTFTITELRGKVRADAKNQLSVIQECIVTGTKSSDEIAKPISEATTITEATMSWAWNSMPDIKLDKYQMLKFYAYNKNTAGASLELRVGTDDSTYRNWIVYSGWTEVCFVKDDAGKWSTYLAGVRCHSALEINNLNQLQINYGANTYYFSEVFAIKEPVAPKGDMLVSAPWAFEIGTLNNDMTWEDGGYTCATLVSGSDPAYKNPALFSYLDLSTYQEIHFALKSSNDGWYQMQYASNPNEDICANNSSSWQEFKFVNEGGEYFQTYIDGEKTGSIKLPIEGNLNALQMKYSSDPNAVLYMTEVRGTLKEGATNPLIKVADSFNTYEGIMDVTERPIGLATQSTIVSTQWSSNQVAFAELELNNYETVLFYLRNIESLDPQANWFVSDLFGSQVFGSKWVEFRMEKNSDSTWNLYRGGRNVAQQQHIDNLSDITATYGNVKYAFSQVFAIASQTQEKTYAFGDVNKDEAVNVKDLVFEKRAVAEYQEKTIYKKACDLSYDKVLDRKDLDKMRNHLLTGEVSVARAPWAYNGGTEDAQIETQAHTCGYENTTSISIGTDSYATALMTDVDLSIYKEIRFAIKSDGTAWWQMCKATDEFSDSNNYCASQSAEWLEIRFTDVGSGCLQMYVNDQWVNHSLPLNGNLSDLKMTYYLKGELQMTDLRGTLRENVSNELGVLLDATKAAVGEVSYSQLPIFEAKKVTPLNEQWDHNGTLPSLDLDNYKLVKFYVKSGVDTERYLELGYNNSWPSVGYQKRWVEVKFVRSSDGTWNIYMAGELKHEKLVINNMNQIYISYGNGGLCYVSEVFGIEQKVVTTDCEIVDKNGQAKYNLTYQSEDAFAAQEFVDFMKETTNADFSDVSSSKSIVIGSSMAKNNNMDFSGLTTDNGYVITVDEDDIYVYGKTTQGTLNGVYELLNRAVELEIYTGDCYTYNYEAGTAVTVDCKEEHSVYNPSIDYKYDLNGETRPGVGSDSTYSSKYQKRMGFVTDYTVLGGSAHAESEFVKNTTYFTGTTVNEHMPLDDTTAKQAAQWFYDTQIKNVTSKESFLFGLKDDLAWCDTTTYGQKRTDQYVTFMNKMAEELSTIMTNAQDQRTISLVMVAYNHTIIAPSVTLESQSNIRMSVMFAPVQANWYKALTDAVNNQVSVRDNNVEVFAFDADQEMQKWKDKVQNTGDLYLWSYHNYYDSYLTPFDSFKSMFENFKYAANLGVKGIYDTVQYDNAVATDWNRLKVYLRSALLQSENLSELTETEYETLITNFMKAYFGPAYENMKSAWTSERTVLATVYNNQSAGKDVTFNQNYGCGQASVMFATQGNYSKWGMKRDSKYNYSGSLKSEVYSQMTQALTIISDAKNKGTITATQAETYTNRIKLEMIAVRFILLAVPEQKHPDNSNTDTFELLAADCNTLGITRYREGTPAQGTITAAQLQQLAGYN